MYTPFTNRNIQSLAMVRHGQIKPWYELTDGVNSYGKLVYKWVSFRRTVSAETATDTWQFRFENFWKTSMLISDAKGQDIGRLTSKPFKRNSTLVLNDGFTVIFRKTSFWKHHYVWESETYGPILQIQSPFISKTTNIIIEQSTAPTAVLPLLAFLGVHVILIRKQREAAAASS